MNFEVHLHMWYTKCQCYRGDDILLESDTLSFSQPVYSLFAADKGINHETEGRTAIKIITCICWKYLKE